MTIREHLLPNPNYSHEQIAERLELAMDIADSRKAAILKGDRLRKLRKRR